jgi:uncharacterized protein
MALNLNVRHLEEQPVRFEGTLDAAELDLDRVDDLIRPAGPMRYAFEASRQERGILLQGILEMDFQCDCARCLAAYPLSVRLDGWVCLLPSEGEEAAAAHGDCVDLTPYLREDMFLALPQRPLCKPDCVGLLGREPASAPASKALRAWEGPASVWQELDRSRF